MDWSSIRTGIKGWFAGATGLPVVWMNEARPMTTKPMGILQIISTSAFGPDIIQNTYIDTNPVGTPPTIIGQEIVTSVHGLRKITVSCMVVSRDQTSNHDALYYLEQARGQLYRPSLLALLKTANLSVLNMNNAIKISDGIFQDRYESKAVLDITFSTAENLTFDDVQDNSTYIDTISLSSELENPDDEQLELDNAIIGNI